MKIHVLEKNDSGYRVVVHKSTAAGNNSAGISWKNVLLGAGLNTTRMPEGTSAGQISTLEKSQILAGDVVEMEFTVLAESGGTSAVQLQAALTLLVDQQVSMYFAAFQRRYKYFGYTQDV